jgi:uncharacterized protein YjbJ (UPF0337 family)
VGFWDRLFGRGKQAAGDMTGDESMRSEGMHQEAKAEAEQRAEGAEQMAQDARESAAEHDIRQDREAEN